MSTNVGTRQFLDLQLERGRWYISNPHQLHAQFGTRPKGRLRACIVVGPFGSQIEAYDCKEANRLGSIVWQQQIKE